jgi:hypothetical protein
MGAFSHVENENFMELGNEKYKMNDDLPNNWAEVAENWRVQGRGFREPTFIESIALLMESNPSRSNRPAPQAFAHLDTAPRPPAPRPPAPRPPASRAPVHMVQPKKVVPAHMATVLLKSPPEDRECPICKDTIDSDLYMTPCFHIFHLTCVEKCDKCPMCREKI